MIQPGQEHLGIAEDRAERIADLVRNDADEELSFLERLLQPLDPVKQDGLSGAVPRTRRHLLRIGKAVLARFGPKRRAFDYRLIGHAPEPTSQNVTRALRMNRTAAMLKLNR